MGDMLSSNLRRSCWIDATGHCVLLRENAIPEMREYVGQIQHDTFYNQQSGFNSILRWVKRILELQLESLMPNFESCEDWDFAYVHLICTHGDARFLPTVVFPTVYPSNQMKFMLHLLYSLGHFDTELDLVGTDFYSIFQKANLIPHGNQGEDISVKCLLKKYCEEQLFHYPIKSDRMDQVCLRAKKMLVHALFRDESLMGNPGLLPPCIYTAMHQATNDEMEIFLKEVRTNMAAAVAAELKDLSPDTQLLVESTRGQHCPYPTNLPATPTQTEESHLEHQMSTETLRRSIEAYITVSQWQTKGILLNGPPGVGKTFNCLYAAGYALSLGLCAITTALLSTRAAELGGIHIHELFAILPGLTSPEEICQHSVEALLRNPKLAWLIMNLDVLIIDEVGQNSAQLFSALEMICRAVRNRSDFFGGIHVICTIDECQITPIDGLPFLTSPHVVSSFKLITLDHPVRAEEENLRLACKLVRTPAIVLQEQPELIEQIVGLVSENATFVDDWDSPRIPHDAIRVFGKKKPAKLERERYLHNIIENLSATNTPYSMHKAVDQQIPHQSHANWIPASSEVSRQLDRKCREPDCLFFFEGAVYECSENTKEIGVSYTQLLVLFEVPTEEMLQRGETITFLCGPHGERNVPIMNREELLSRGWKEVKIGINSARPKRINRMMKGRRFQYRLRPRITATIHQVMGSTLGSVACKISNTDVEYALWEKGQLVVLISRTNRFRNLIFVGNKRAILEAMRSILRKKTMFDEYVHHVLDVLRGSTSGEFVPLDLTKFPYQVCGTLEHQNNSGACYLLCSVPFPETNYIGQTTRSLAVRLDEHNRGNGGVQTSPAHLRPWTPIAYVCGFEHDSALLMEFERQWQASRQHRLMSLQSCTALDIAHLASAIVEREEFLSLGLRVVLMVKHG